MKKLVLMVLALAILGGCATPPHDVEPYEPQYRGKYSDDPLLDSVFYWRHSECLRRCAEGDLKKCD